MNDYLDFSDFEEMLLNAFPIEKPENIDWTSNRVSREAEDVFKNKSWRDLVGFQLGLLDCCFSHNLKLFPIEASVYYLPSFLLSAMLQLYHADNEITFPTEVANGLYLAIPDTVEQRAEVDSLLCTMGAVSDFPEGRLALFHALNTSQKKCVAKFLDLYEKYYAQRHNHFYRPHARACFSEIVQCWELGNYDVIGHASKNLQS